MSSSASSGGGEVAGPFPIPDRPGYQAWTSGGSRFEVQSRYKLTRAVGTGAYGVVVAAEDALTGAKVAIKKVPNAFNDLTDGLRIVREIRLMRHFNHENIISVVDLGPPPSLASFSDVYIILQLMESDMHRIIYSRQPLTDEHLQWFIFQILLALKYIHSANVIHRDLKPSNLLVNSDCTVKVCDFGLVSEAVGAAVGRSGSVEAGSEEWGRRVQKRQGCFVVMPRVCLSHRHRLPLSCLCPHRLVVLVVALKTSLTSRSTWSRAGE